MIMTVVSSPPRSDPGARRRSVVLFTCCLSVFMAGQQDVRGYSALQAGLLTIPMAVMLGVLSVVSGRLVARRGPRPRDQAGVAGAIASTCRPTGAAVGVAVTGAIIASSSAGFIHASPAAWAVVAGCGAMVVLLGIVSTGRWALGTAERNGTRLAAAGPAPEGAR